MFADVQTSAEAKVQIESVLRELTESWNRHDMATFASQFTDDADFINVIGMHWRGRAEIEARHAEVHRTFFRNSSLRTVDWSLRPLSANVVLAHLQWEMTGHEAPPGVNFAPLRNGVLTAVFIEQGGRWLITALQNTDIVPIAVPGATK